MRKLQWRSDTRRQRTVHVGPTVDRWLEQEAGRWGISYSEAMNRLLASYRQFHNDVTVEKSTGDQDMAQLMQATLKGFGAQLTEQIERLTSEVEQVKSNLHLLQILQDRAVAKTLTPRQYDEWREEARGMLAKRQGGKA